MRVFAFVRAERSLRPRVGLFAPLRDNLTSSEQLLAPFRSAQLRSSLSILTEPHDELTSSSLFAERKIMECSAWAHSTLMPADLITLAHFSIWSAMNFPNSADVRDIG